jgi:DHA2 family multidrug resistance protein
MIDMPRGGATWIGFLAMCLGMFMAILDVQVVVTSLSVIQDALEIGEDRMSWVQTAYLTAEIVAIPLTGLLARVFGLRWLFVAALIVFTAASIGCAAATGFASLIAWRVVQGLAGGLLIPAVFSAVFLLFPGRGQTLATTIAGLLAVLAPTLGPLIGGWLTETWSWHWLFLINVVPGIVAALLAFLFLPREEPRFGELGGLDWLSLAAMATGLAALEIALKQGPDNGWFSPITLGLLSIAAAAAFAFVTRPRPAVKIALLADRRFAAACGLSFVLGVGLFGSVYLMPLFLAFVRGHGPLDIGQFMLVTGAAQLIVTPIAIQLEKRLDARLLTALGFALFAFGAALSGFQTSETDFNEMILPQILRGAAIMFCLLPPTRLALAYLAPSDVSDGSGLFNLMRNLGGALGIALIDTLIFTRAPDIADSYVSLIKAGDAAAVARFGVDPDDLAQGADPAALMSLMSDLQQAAMVDAINEAWLMIAAGLCIGLLAVFATESMRAAKADAIPPRDAATPGEVEAAAPRAVNQK